jgi:hypothetical protein
MAGTGANGTTEVPDSKAETGANVFLISWLIYVKPPVHGAGYRGKA